MDGVSAAASVVGLVGQLIQSIKALHDFWSSVRDIPTRLQWLSKDLHFLQQTLEQIEQNAIRDPGVSEDMYGRQALEMCTLHIAKLEELIRPLQPQLGEGRTIVFRKSVKAVFCVEKMERCRKRIEEAKTTILLAYYSLNRASIFNVERSIVKLNAGQSAATHTVAANHASTLSAIASLQHDVRTIMAFLESKTGNALVSLTQASLESTISPILERKLKECLPRSEITRLTQSQVDNSGEQAASFHDQSASMVKRRRRVRWKQFPTPFGHVLLYYDVISQTWTNSKPYDRHRAFDYGLVFVPRPLLARWVTLVTATWSSGPFYGLSDLTIQFRPILSSNSEIFTACREGDVDTMKTLFRWNLASPQVVNEKGEDLLQHALEAPIDVRLETCKLLLAAGCRSNTSIEGHNPLDKVMSAWTPADLNTDFTNPAAALDCDLEVMRLLVEVGGLKQMNCRKLLMGLIIRSLLGLPYNPPALDYLCKQHFFEFSLSTVLSAITSKGDEMREDHKISDFSSCLRALLACGDDQKAPLDSRTNTLMLTALVKLTTMETFNDAEEQKAGFNTIVLTLSLSIRYGFRPNCKLLAGGYLDTASKLADSDPKFTAVAWRLALEYNEWALPDHISVDQRGSESYNPEVNPDQEAINAGTISKDDEDFRPVPGAWIEEEPKPRHQTQVLRKFQSVPDDFKSIIRGRFWDKELYSKLKP